MELSTNTALFLLVVTGGCLARLWSNNRARKKRAKKLDAAIARQVAKQQEKRRRRLRLEHHKERVERKTREAAADN